MFWTSRKGKLPLCVIVAALTLRKAFHKQKHTCSLLQDRMLLNGNALEHVPKPFWGMTLKHCVCPVVTGVCAHTYLQDHADCVQVLRQTPPSKRDRTAVDTLRALVRGRVWFWQTTPFFYSAFPELPCWRWPVFRCECASNLCLTWPLVAYRSI